MVTFLEYLIQRRIGPPTSGSGNGVSYWHCPSGEHEDRNPSFDTMPLSEQYKHRYFCLGCGASGGVGTVHHRPATEHGRRAVPAACWRGPRMPVTASEPGQPTPNGRPWRKWQHRKPLSSEVTT
jgi:hypothetical protein